jgi:hypothetical protein
LAILALYSDMSRAMPQRAALAKRARELQGFAQIGFT